MNVVQPIRDKELLQEIKHTLKQRNERNYMLFLLGTNTALRISDILKLKVKDVEGWYITIREQKTNKHKKVKMTMELKREIQKYIQNKDKHEYLFKSRQGKNKPITRSAAYKVLRQIGEEFDLEEFSCHSLRKTFGYHFYKQHQDIVSIQKLLNHTDPKVTLRYIGIEQEELDDMMTKTKI
ncbi:site-specific integrase (plasmid) [Bacillus carboniphilus]|uniref:Site-specific integrase n=1 Tax=Bacillus carboniphilus TaxID=86663 RepID=A0ABY9JYE5_9BACI|nr:site-specific integrase [Bacillus carboniphilus]WLR44412.1 site-specific integrase [Bacillus carboniphilus]